MEKSEKDEQLIDKLIRKRKEENDAFTKLLHAIGGKKVTNEKIEKTNKNKSCL
jgi:hypothetical protein